MLIFSSNNTHVPPCPSFMRWTQSSIDKRQDELIVCIIASIIHGIFWSQLLFCSSARQKSMQWIYAYLITDILLLFRFFFVYIVRTISTECEPNPIWVIFVCYFEAIVDNYLNILEVYILLALNICRYVQIAYNRNVYTTDVKLLVLAHLSIYVFPIISLVIQVVAGWAQLEYVAVNTCDIGYTNIYVQIFNIITGFALPIMLNILVIYASVDRIHVTSALREGQHHVPARVKYHRSLVIQFLCFYVIWLALWSPNVIVYQISLSTSNLSIIVRLLNSIVIALDPIIIAALDIRFWQAWKKFWLRMNNQYFRRLQPRQRQIRPIITNSVIKRIEQQGETRL